MKHLFSIFSMLVLVVLSAGCSDNENSLETHYEPFEVEESHGRLYYDTKAKQWCIATLDIPPVVELQVAHLLIDNLPKEYEIFKDKWIIFSGIAQFLRHDDNTPVNLYFSFKVESMKLDER